MSFTYADNSYDVALRIISINIDGLKRKTSYNITQSSNLRIVLKARRKRPNKKQKQKLNIYYYIIN